MPKSISDDIFDTSTIKSKVLSPFPEPGKDFHKRIFYKKEFLETAQAATDKLTACNEEDSPFQLLPHQKFVRNFLSPVSAYRGLLLFHGTGSGKTASAIVVAEAYKSKMMSQESVDQRQVMILYANNAIGDNFRNTIYSAAAATYEVMHRMPTGTRQVTGAQYYVHNTVPSKKQDNIKQLYEKYYNFVSREKFTRRMRNLLYHYRQVRPHDSQNAFRSAVADEFSNRLIIVDEIHNIKDSESSHETEDASDGDSDAEYKPYQALMDVVSYAKNVKLLLMSATPCYNEPSEIVPILNLLLANESRSLLHTDDIFHCVQSGDITVYKLKASAFDTLKQRAGHLISYVRGKDPSTFPASMEVNDHVNHARYAKNVLYLPKPQFDVRGDKINPKTYLKHTIIIKCAMSERYMKCYLQQKDSIRMTRNVALKEDRDLCSVMYPSSDSTGRFGRAGFDEAFYAVNRGSWTYRYRPHAAGFLSKNNLKVFSPKYACILENLLKSPGIAFVYSENLYIGVYTLAMMLDANGYESFDSNTKSFGNVTLKNNDVPLADKICAVCNLTRSHKIHRSDGQSKHAFKQAHYVIIKGQEGSSSNNEIIERLKRTENLSGHSIKIILGSPVTRESMDFRNIRQIHIASVWHNMSRINQIIGRGIRNCSHQDLPASERNVTLFRYSLSLPEDVKQKMETADENMWRRSEVKDIAIKSVERLLKMVAIDCPFNKKSNMLRYKDYTADCDYDRCQFPCVYEYPAHIVSSMVDSSTYFLANRENEIISYQFWISRLFDTHTAMSFSAIQHSLSLNGINVNLQALATAVQRMIGDQRRMPEIIHTQDDIYGYLIRVGSLYIFQPLLLKDRRVPLALRRKAPRQSVHQVHMNNIQHTKSIQRVDKEAQTLIRHLHSFGDEVDMYSYLDFHVHETEMISLLEHVIEKKVTTPLLSYFKDFLLLTPCDKSLDSFDCIRGHFLFDKPRCLTNGAWQSCPLHERANVLHMQRGLYSEPLAAYVGYIDANKTLSFKLINNQSHQQRFRHDMQIAKNTIRKGKDCRTFNRAELNNIFRELDIRGTASPDKNHSCRTIEFALRKLQASAKGQLRYFWNKLEWQSGRPADKLQQ